MVYNISTSGVKQLTSPVTGEHTHHGVTVLPRPGPSTKAGHSENSLDPSDFPDDDAPAAQQWRVDEYRGDQVEDRGHVRRGSAPGGPDGRTLKTRGTP